MLIYYRRPGQPHRSPLEAPGDWTTTRSPRRSQTTPTLSRSVSFWPDRAARPGAHPGWVGFI